MMNWIRTIGWIVLTAVATYAISEWALWKNSGLHDLSISEERMEVDATPAPLEPERQALQAQVDRLAETFGALRAAKEREIADLQRLIANLERQIRVLTAQRTPEQQVAAFRAESRPVRLKTVEQDGASEGTRQGAHNRLSLQARDAAPPTLLELARAVGFTRVEVRR